MPEAEFSRFRDWTRLYLAADPAGRPALVEQGRALAEARREELAALIRSNPERALMLAVPQVIRRELPTAVTALLEERVDGRGDLAVLAATPQPGEVSAGPAGWRTVTLGDRIYQAFVYGRRAEDVTRLSVALHGVAVGDLLAVDENPVRVLEAAEAALALAGDPSCGVSGQLAAEFGTPTAVDVGETAPKVLCGTAHAEWLNQTIAEEESDPGLEVVEGTGTRIRRTSVYTEGSKRLIFIRVDFSDRAGAPFTDQAGTNMVRGLDTFFRENSYNRTSVRALGSGSALTATLRLPKTAAAYGAGDASTLRSDARAAATKAGFVLGNYDFDLICFTSVPGYSWAGLGYVGAPGCWIQGAFDAAAGVPAHELGHNLGLNHANFWDTGGASVTGGSGTDVEYGDSFDTMGNASAGRRHFNVRNKAALDWLRTSEVRTLTTNGIYRVFAHDFTNAVSGVRALRVARNAKTNYWFEFRQKFTDNRWLLNGLGVRWARSDNNRQSLLLDTTPGSADGKNDAAFVLGRTFSDFGAGLHVTPLRKNGTVPESLDVMFVKGRFPTNTPPQVAVNASAAATIGGSTVTFRATAADAEDAELAYYWDFGDGNFGTNGLTASKSWTTSGDYLVRCTVSDLRGGIGTDSVVVRVGNPSTFRLSGRVLREGQPLGGVRVFTSNTRLTYTDSDGSYVLTGMTAGTYTLRAQAEGLIFTRAGFTNPLVVSGSRTGLDFTGTLPGDLELATLIPAGATWRYHDSGVNLGTAWRAPAYGDAAWKQGAAQLGYGDDDVTTVLNFGADAASKFPTYYFRHAFFVDDPARFLNVTLGLVRDDGGVVYLNGKEVFRSNLPGGTISYATLASGTVGGEDESTFYETELAAADFVKGRNVLAVEIHQSVLDSSDLSFNLRLDALLAPTSGVGTAPALVSKFEGESLRVAWPAAFTGYNLQQRADLGDSVDWEPSPFPVTTVGDENVVTVPIGEGVRLLRLAK